MLRNIARFTWEEYNLLFQWEVFVLNLTWAVIDYLSSILNAIYYAVCWQVSKLLCFIWMTFYTTERFKINLLMITLRCHRTVFSLPKHMVESGASRLDILKLINHWVHTSWGHVASPTLRHHSPQSSSGQVDMHAPFPFEVYPSRIHRLS